jgi:L-rhamnose mutarotase
MKRYCLALDLKDDPQKIAEYEEIHKAVWPGVLEHIRANGVLNMELYRTGNRLFMIMETVDDFDPQVMATSDQASPLIQEWEAFMWGFQQPLPWAKPGEKWVMTNRIFKSAAD